MVICLIAAILSSIWTDIYKYDYTYLALESYYTSFFYSLAVIFGTWFISMMNFVPISLMVTLEMVKFIQAYFITWDYRIYDESKDMETKVQSSNLNEELGMIHYVFSDKTGTLT